MQLSEKALDANILRWLSHVLHIPNLGGGQWLDNGWRWSVGDVEKGVKSVTNVLALANPTRLCGWVP